MILFKTIRPENPGGFCVDADFSVTVWKIVKMAAEFLWADPLNFVYINEMRVAVLTFHIRLGQIEYSNNAKLCFCCTKKGL